MTPGAAGSGAILVTIGDEILLGRTVDTNSALLGRSLADLGVRVIRSETVPDQDARIGRTLQAAVREAELVVLTGGLGPTADDHTREAVAEALGRPLEHDAEVAAHLERWYESRDGTPPPTIVQRIAQVHRGARAILNPIGTAPAIWIEHDEALVVLLPGVPREMEALFDLLAPELRSRFGRPAVAIRSWSTSGIPESRLAPRVDEALEAAGLGCEVDGTPWELAWLPGLRGVGIRATVPGVEPDRAAEILDRVAAVLDPVIAPWRLPDSAEGEAVRAVGDALQRRGWMLSTAESCTGGLVAKRITDQPGSSGWFLGSVVAYSNAAKTQLLGVPEAIIETHGAVSEEVARAMAKGAADRFGSDAAVALTGIAGPGGGTEEKPVGTVCWAVVAGGTVEVRRHRFHGDREAVRERSAQAALMTLFRLLEEEDA